MEQEQTVYCLLEGTDVFAVMPTGLLIACREVLE
jgi:superfamily II DNA helicase RecQ